MAFDEHWPSCGGGVETDKKVVMVESGGLPFWDLNRLERGEVLASCGGADRHIHPDRPAERFSKGLVLWIVS